ncbi:hypothetical protein Micbo1qcDRAFT_165278 [Microdochium bolleyi]|uniref:Uncharacterized protein n=1 Tax=Microdochium bolleyi TaxID=196109 RepID=A0A136IYB5_9PEZI|nr:hypothetical protein Micbo1qcDRAFT_165278 [Microdochium bolleyi]
MGFFDTKYRAYRDARAGRSAQFSDEEIEKYTGKTRAELDKWAVSTEGVGRWQKASSMMAGGTVGLGMGEMPTHVRGTTLKYGPQWEQRQRDWEEQREQEQRRQEEEEEVKDTTEGKAKGKGKEHSA